MEKRPLGRTGLELSVLSFGASSLGQEFRSVDLGEALRSVRVAVDRGMNFIDTSLAEVQDVLRPIHNWFYVEGRPENNDEPRSPEAA